MTAVTYTLDGETIHLSSEDILQRLGPEATMEDVTLFVKLWDAMFTTGDRVPAFGDRQDLDSSWAEIVALM